MTLSNDIPHIAKQITQHCPKLTTVKNMGLAGNLATWELLMRILEELPEQQASTFRCLGRPFMIRGLNDTGSLFRRQSGTLRDIELAGCLNIDSRAIQVILVERRVLEKLIVKRTKDEDLHRSCIKLEDAIKFPWASTRIQDLQLTITIPEQPLYRPPNNTEPYYSRPPPTTLSTAEQQQFDNFEALYRQVGALKKLRRLDLRALYFDPQAHRLISEDFKASSFPGMLSLSSETTGRPGYLHHFAGLTELKILEGSVRVTTKETMMTVGMAEAKWMEEHWPALMAAHFVGASIKLPEHLRWFKEQRDKKGQKLNLAG
ncbi:hypothetical protein BGW39_004436 [Mortierella sp. 14UC]|nr:hypothetical protein BGW39_004436 [Mortierella sp. 14UC]